MIPRFDAYLHKNSESNKTDNSVKHINRVLVIKDLMQFSILAVQSLATCQMQGADLCASSWCMKSSIHGLWRYDHYTILT